jgi:hypothetical protein
MEEKHHGDAIMKSMIKADIQTITQTLAFPRRLGKK